MTTRPEKCQACGFSSRHTQQLPGEKPEFAACCSKWMCAACRNDKGCTGDSDHAVIATARRGYPNGVPPNDGIYSRIPETVYHGDPTSLSSSGARTILNGTPAQFNHDRNEPPKPKPEYDFGHAAHKMVLGEGAQLGVLDPNVHGITKDGKLAAKPSATTAWKEAEARFREQGKTPIMKAQMDVAQRMAGQVFENRLAARLLERGNAEMSGYWHDDNTGVRLRFRPDFIPELSSGRMILVDYKSAKSANPSLFRRSIEDYGYHQQAAWYLDGLAEVQISDDAGFIFIVQEKTAPYLVSVVQLESEDIERGRRQNRAAIDLYARCVESGQWPGYGDGIHTVPMSNWTRNRIDDQLATATREESL